MFEKGNKLNYFGKTVEVVDFDKKYVLVRFESGTKLCTSKTTFLK